MSAPLVIGIDVGGSKLAGVALRGDDVLTTSRRALDGRALDDQVVAMVRELESVADLGHRPLAAVGIAVPGQVDTRTGVIGLAVNLAADGLPIGALVEAQLGVPCLVEHDARAVAGWLARQPGAPSDLAYLSVGTGISAGVVIGGRVLDGADGLAGEIGHLLADPAGPPCACGLTGCLEALASGPAVARAVVRDLEGGASSSLSAADGPEEIYRASADGDPVARRIVDRATRHLAAAIRGLSLAYGVSLVTVGGGVTRAGEAFAVPLHAALDAERAASGLVRRAVPAHGVVVIGDDERPLGALGAASFARQRLGSPAAESAGEVALG